MTKGSILFLTSNEVDFMSRTYLNASPVLAGVLGGISGGAAQAYLTMGTTYTYSPSMTLHLITNATSRINHMHEDDRGDTA